MIDLGELNSWLDENPEPSREMAGRLIFYLFAKEMGARSYVWRDQGNWILALSFQTRPKRSPDRDDIHWFDGTKYIAMNELRVPAELTKSALHVLTLLDFMSPVQSIEIDNDGMTVSLTIGEERIAATGPNMVVAAAKALILLEMKIRNEGKGD